MSVADDAAVTPASRCPSCGYRFDRASCPTNPTAKPEEGDFTICIECGCCLVFGRGLIVRAATPAEVLTLPADVKRALARTTAAILAVQRQRHRS